MLRTSSRVVPAAPTGARRSAAARAGGDAPVAAALPAAAPPAFVRDDERFTGPTGPLRGLVWDDTTVRTSSRGVVAADEANRILAVSAPLAQALGWRVDDLVGRRIVALVPPRFREAHVAGFSRHLSTGDTRVLGVEIDLPVLRADGSEVLCRFLIESDPTATGAGVYLAWITPGA